MTGSNIGEPGNPQTFVLSGRCFPFDPGCLMASYFGAKWPWVKSRARPTPPDQMEQQKLVDPQDVFRCHIPYFCGRPWASLVSISQCRLLGDERRLKKQKHISSTNQSHWKEETIVSGRIGPAHVEATPCQAWSGVCVHLYEI